MGLFDWLRVQPKPLPSVRLAVYCTEEMLPCPLQIAHPDGLLGSLLGVPRALDGGSKSRLPLETSMVPGSYTFTGESGTVLARVSRRGPGDSYPGCDDALKATYRGLGTVERGWLEGSAWAVHLEISEVDTGETEALLYIVEVADRLATLAAGLVLDEAGRRYYLPGARQSQSSGADSVT
jgi:hypothetical protein